MKIEKAKIKDLISPEYNPRDITPDEMEKLKTSIQEFGYVDPIIVNEHNNHIVGGNQRYEALKALEYTEVDVVYINETDPNREKALNIALNKISGDWDEVKLNQIFEEMQLEHFDISLTGFDDLNLDLLNVEPKTNSSSYDLKDDGEEHKDNLSKKYIVPPFSVLDTKSKRWQDRKKEWLQLTDNLSETRTGEYGEIGGGGGLLSQINEGTSNFDPVLAEIILTWFTKEGSIILDPFGGEQTKGVVAGELNFEYHGVEIREEQVELNNKKTVKYPLVHYYPGNSNNIKNIVPPKKYDTCFTSPPYYDLEIYSKEDMSALGSYEEFMQQYKNIFKQCYDLLEENSFLIVKIGEIRDKQNGEYRCFVSDNIDLLTDIGFKYYNEIILLNNVGTAPIRANNNMKSRKIVKIHQNVLVFYKGDVQKIKEHYPLIEINEEEFNEEY